MLQHLRGQIILSLFDIALVITKNGIGNPSISIFVLKLLTSSYYTKGVYDDVRYVRQYCDKSKIRYLFKIIL